MTVNVLYRLQLPVSGDIVECNIESLGVIDDDNGARATSVGRRARVEG